MAATQFIFDSHSVDDDRRTCRFGYRITFDDPTEDVTLEEVLVFPVDIDQADPVVARLLRALHIGLGVSYYKTFVPPAFELGELFLSPAEAEYWNGVYLNGLGEFLYTNKLEPARLARFTGNTTAGDILHLEADHAGLLALGGGKDSIVAGELLRTLTIPLSAYVLATGENHGQTAEVASAMGLELLGVQRTLDPRIMELNKRPDAYNGHVPISMVFALAGLLICAATRQRYLIVANEASASIPNTEWQGMSINHQWSKSFEFESSLQMFVQTTISPDLWYFSAIRPLSSVAVAKLFARYPQYLPSFTSCNLVFRIDPAQRPNGRWCGQCPKCLSSFIILAPWIEEQQLIDTFGKNMLDDVALQTLFLELTGLEGHKPLDCVGTDEEMVLSLNLAARQGKFSSTALMAVARERSIIRGEDWDAHLNTSLELKGEYSFPPELTDTLLDLLRKELSA
jgi:hypothetical protein